MTDKQVIGVKLRSSKDNKDGTPKYNNTIYSYVYDLEDVVSVGDMVVCQTKKGASEGKVVELDYAIPNGYSIDTLSKCLDVGVTLEGYKSKRDVTDYDLIADPIEQEILIFLSLINEKEYSLEKDLHEYIKQLLDMSDITKHYKIENVITSNRYDNYHVNKMTFSLLDENDRYADGSLRGWFDMYYRIPKRNIPVNPQATRYEVSEKDLSYYKRGIFNP